MNISSVLFPDVIIPNTQINLTPNQPFGNATIYFSSYNQKPITIYWVRDLSNVTTIESTLLNGTLSIKVNGNFQPDYNYNITVTQQICNIISQTNGSLQCSIPLFIINPNIPINLNVNSPYQSFIKPIYIQNSPVVTGTSHLTTDGGRLSLTGMFGTNITEVSVFVNGVDRSVVSVDQTQLVTQVDSTGLVVGYANLTVVINKVVFQSSTLLFIDQIEHLSDCGVKNNLCNGHGDCNNNGLCSCYTGFGGYYCEYTLSPDVTVLPTDTSPSIITTKSKLDFNMVEIQELGIDHQIVRVLPTTSWTISSSTDGTLTTFNYILDLVPNQPLLEVIVTFQFSSEARSLLFGGQDLNLLPNTLKMTVSINQWQFLNNINSLRPVFTNTMTNLTERADAPCQDNRDSTTTIKDNLTKSLSYIQVIFEDIVYFGRFLPIALANGRPTSIINEVINTTVSSDPSNNIVTYIGINLPQCSQCTIDPDFSVLVSTKSDCPSKSNSNKIMIIAIVVPVVVIAVLVGLLVAFKTHLVIFYKTHIKKSLSAQGWQLKSI
ncbi:hypothetical protein SAMD00019534_082140 [Acytostelium subglobosum LB1]|uniref:hypothetical protein n=1 Tax=Acytostelium subglobosum LB1 TaxID=1410327 RepID=UPI000644F20A|nr:hypothetical protein SAMD00019534_082140 [Acytostelium subglobosum LB1]GAM25039.1 hypothetical protein SAMD00019534_082140 [Acytostelium subglobosum LB1]|eukprot:XP_012752128.1 hypothetical protein SAMD00019534_082140 [Acytostelium subglobosum LB1]